ncbi:MAG: hypothetical protein GY910_27210 [bacterium]|nr:hypothetical protein [bacterium]
MSLVEIMVAMVVLSFGLLGVAALQVRAITEGSGGQHLSSAGSIARNRVEELNRVAWDATELNNSGGAWSAATNIAALDQTYARSERVAWDAATVPLVTLKTVEVRVTWDDTKRLNRQVLLTSARLRETDE